jgi:hypothetical protein
MRIKSCTRERSNNYNDMSVVVNFNEWGRMGNRMFQYAFGYILAAKKCVNLYHDGLPNFNIQPNPYTGKLVNYINTGKYGHNKVDYKELINTSNIVVVDSYLQKSLYYEPHRETLLHQFNIKQHESINKDKLVLHIRETDYLQINCFLGYDFYKRVIKEAGYTNIVIVTDNSTSETVQKLLAEGCKLNTEGIVNTFNVNSDDRAMIDFNTLLYSENIAISQSSYSWWASFLGNHKNIYMPYCEGMWKLNPLEDDINLYLNSSNIIKIS